MKLKIIIFFLLIGMLLFVGCTEKSNEQNQVDNGIDNTNDDTNDDGSGEYASNIDMNLVGNWTWISGNNNGEPVTQIINGWVHFKQDGTWKFAYDYDYTMRIQNGTWQARDGELYWGTAGQEISDWYSIDSYKFGINDGDLSIMSGNSVMNYLKQ